MNSIEAAITKEINDLCALPCYGATNATEEEQQRGRLAGLTWALNLVVQTQSHDPLRCAVERFIQTRGRHEGPHDMTGVYCIHCEASYVRAETELDKAMKFVLPDARPTCGAQEEIERIAARIAKGAASGEKSEGQIEFEILELVKGSARGETL